MERRRMGRTIGFIREVLSCKQFSNFSVSIKGKNNEMVILVYSCLTLSSSLFQNGSFGDSLGMRYSFILMPNTAARVVSVCPCHCRLKHFLICIDDITYIDHILICPSTTFETYFWNLYKIKPLFYPM